MIPFDQIALATSARLLPCAYICNEKFAAAVRCERRLMNAHARMRRKAKGFHWCALAADDVIVECSAVASGEAEKRISFSNKFWISFEFKLEVSTALSGMIHVNVTNLLPAKYNKQDACFGRATDRVLNSRLCTLTQTHRRARRFSAMVHCIIHQRQAKKRLQIMRNEARSGRCLSYRWF